MDPTGWTTVSTLDNNTGNLLSHPMPSARWFLYYRMNGLVDTSTDANAGSPRSITMATFLITKIDRAQTPGVHFTTTLVGNERYESN